MGIGQMGASAGATDARSHRPNTPTAGRQISCSPGTAKARRNCRPRFHGQPSELHVERPHICPSSTAADRVHGRWQLSVDTAQGHRTKSPEQIQQIISNAVAKIDLSPIGLPARPPKRRLISLSPFNLCPRRAFRVIPINCGTPAGTVRLFSQRASLIRATPSPGLSPWVRAKPARAPSPRSRHSSRSDTIGWILSSDLGQALIELAEVERAAPLHETNGQIQPKPKRPPRGFCAI